MLGDAPKISEVNGAIVYREAIPVRVRIVSAMTALAVFIGWAVWMGHVWQAQDWSQPPEGLPLFLTIFFFLVLPVCVFALMALIAFSGQTEMRLDPATREARLVRTGPFRRQSTSFALQDIKSAKVVVLDNATDADIAIAMKLPDGGLVHLTGFFSRQEAQAWVERIRTLAA